MEGELLEKLSASLTAAKSKVRQLKADGASPESVLIAVADMKAIDEELKKLQESVRGPVFEADGFQDVLVRRMIVVPSFEIYGGVKGLFDLGPIGCALKDNIINEWKKHFILAEKMLPVEATCLTSYNVLKASGHVDRFTDLMVKDEKSGMCYRADKLLEEHIDRVLEKNPGMAQAEREELELCSRQADAYTAEELGRLINERFQIKAPDTGNDLSAPFPFNLMFQTTIGPEGTSVGFLRPETAQGIFVNFKRLYEFNANKLPFAAAQVGLGFRNEISPNRGLIRVREFTMAEIEHFVHPKEKDHPKFASVKDYVLTLFPREQQLTTGKTIRVPAGEAVAKGLVNNETLCYFLCRTAMFFEKIGIDMERLRFRQHLLTEMAHYSSDCWDAEIKLSFGWVECVGHADRSAYDLQVHSKSSKVDLSASRMLDPPVVREYAKVVANKKIVGKAFQKNASGLLEYLENTMPVDDAVRIGEDLAAGKTVNVELPTDTGCVTLAVTPEMMTITRDKKTVHAEVFTPNVIEPSFGVGRCLHALLEHTFNVRRDGGAEEPEQAQIKKGEVARTFFRFTPLVAPVKCGVCPLRRENEVLATEICESLIENGIAATTDTSSTAIGRKYARLDEIGVPYCITVDMETLENGSVTLRERDSCDQIRVASTAIAMQYVAQLCTAQVSFEALISQHGAYRSNAA